MNHGKIIATLNTNDSNDGQICGLAVSPHRGDTFVFRFVLYRVVDVRHTPEPERGGWYHRIDLILEPKQ